MPGDGDPWDADPEEPPWFAFSDEPEEETLPHRSDDWLGAWLQAAKSPAVLAAVAPAAEAWTRVAARISYDPAVAGAAERLAQAEAADAMWLAGDAGARDRLALYAHGLRAAVDGRDQLAHWALRRLTSGADPSALSPDMLRDYLGRARPGHSDGLVEEAADLFPQPTGDELDMALAQWLEIANRLTGHHHLIRAAVLHRAWRWLNLSGPEDPVTPTVVAASIAGGKGLSFAPVAGALRRKRTLAVKGTETDRLFAMIKAFQDGATEAALTLERLAHWRARAGKTATTKAMRAVVDAVARQPVASSNAIADHAGLTPQAVNNATRALIAKGLIREATGQSRFRLWQAPL